MAKVLVLLAPGFEEIEAITVIDLLRRVNIDVTVAGLEFDFVSGSHKIVVKTDLFIDEINSDDYDCIILPGGQPGSDNLKNDRRVLALLREFHNKQKLIAAICAAPLVLKEASLVEGKQITSFPSEKSAFSTSLYSEENVVFDKPLITSRGVGTAIEFALFIIGLFKGEAVKTELAARILWKQKD